jgi:choline dehydrogenase-like flavoprotein
VDDNGRKEIAFNDWALPGGGKLGTVQSFGRLPPATLLVDDLRRRAARAIPGGGALVTLLSPWIRSVVERIERHVILAAILEDLPYADNRVTLDRAGHPAITYRLRPYDAARIAGSRRRMRDLLSPLRPRLFKQSENNERIAHAAGTCRMGDDPSTSVVDGEERAHDLENLRIVDASVFPSAGGTNPGLTIVATARRAADRFLARNGASAARGTR